MVRAEGHTGTVQVGYQVAAQLGAWTLTLEPSLPRRYHITARVDAVSDYWLQHGPWRLALVVGSRIWSWPLEAPGITAHLLTAEVAGAPTVETLSQPIGA